MPATSAARSPRRRRRGQIADAPQTEAGDLVLDRVDVERRLLVGVRRDEGVDDLTAQRAREDDFDAQLVGALVLAHLAHRRTRSLGRQERAFPLGRERAVDVLADLPRAGGEDRAAHGVGVALGHEPHELGELDARRRQRLDPLEVERLADDVGEPAASLVEVGVRDRARRRRRARPAARRVPGRRSP